MNKEKIFIIVFALLFGGNLLFLDYQWLAGRKLELGGKKLEVGREVKSGGEETSEAVGCEQNCREEIAQKVKEEVAKIVLPTSAVVYKTVVPTTAAQLKVVYVPLSASGTIASVDWQDIVPSEFYFDLTNYPGAKEIRLEAYLLSLNNDLITARLYDQTNKRGVDFSDLQCTNSTFTRKESSPIVIWRGNNKYTVQLRSVNGTQAQLKDAKLKIIF